MLTRIWVKKYCTKLRNGETRTYGPYPKDPDLFYIYEVHRIGDRVVHKLVGLGPKPQQRVQDNTCQGCIDLTTLDEQPFCRVLRSFLGPRAMKQPCDLRRCARK